MRGGLWPGIAALSALFGQQTSISCKVQGTRKTKMIPPSLDGGEAQSQKSYEAAGLHERTEVQPCTPASRNPVCPEGLCCHVSVAARHVSNGYVTACFYYGGVRGSSAQFFGIITMPSKNLRSEGESAARYLLNSNRLRARRMGYQLHYAWLAEVPILCYRFDLQGFHETLS